MLQVQDKEAETRLSELLRTVENGETVAITRNGKEVAHLVPPVEDQNVEQPPFDEQTRAERRTAIQRFLDKKATWEPTGITREEILAWRHEGHRY